MENQQGNHEPTKDSKYIQQHLANERTYLAWIRTSITIIGVGFLITNLHFTTHATAYFFADVLAKVIGLGSIIVGIAVLILSTLGYFVKGRDINQQTFRYPKQIIILLSVTLLLIFIVFACYYLFVWGLI